MPAGLPRCDPAVKQPLLLCPNSSGLSSGWPGSVVAALQPSHPAGRPAVLSVRSSCAPRRFCLTAAYTPYSKKIRLPAVAQAPILASAFRQSPKNKSRSPSSQPLPPGLRFPSWAACVSRLGTLFGQRRHQFTNCNNFNHSWKRNSEGVLEVAWKLPSGATVPTPLDTTILL